MAFNCGEPMPGHPFESGAALVGTEIAGRFRLLELLGEGSTGVVYRGVETGALAREVAVRVWTDAPPDAVRRFESEVSAISELRHPSIAKLVDSGFLPNGSFFVAREVVRGPRIRDLLRGAPMSVVRALRLVRQVTDALAEAHGEGLVHGDITSTNVFVEHPGGHEIARLVDFGIAPMTTLPGRDEPVVGRPGSLAPEVILGARPSFRCDMYATGVLLFELLSGAPPFGYDTSSPEDPTPRLKIISAHAREPAPLLSSVAPTSNETLEALVARLLSKTPEDRPESAIELLALLDLELAQLGAAPDSLPVVEGHAARPTLPADVVEPGLPEPSFGPEDSGSSLTDDLLADPLESKVPAPQPPPREEVSRPTIEIPIVAAPRAASALRPRGASVHRPTQPIQAPSTGTDERPAIRASTPSMSGEADTLAEGTERPAHLSAGFSLEPSSPEVGFTPTKTDGGASEPDIGFGPTRTDGGESDPAGSYRNFGNAEPSGRFYTSETSGKFDNEEPTSPGVEDSESSEQTVVTEDEPKTAPPIARPRGASMSRMEGRMPLPRDPASRIGGPPVAPAIPGLSDARPLDGAIPFPAASYSTRMPHGGLHSLEAPPPQVIVTQNTGNRGALLLAIVALLFVMVVVVFAVNHFGAAEVVPPPAPPPLAAIGAVPGEPEPPPVAKEPEPPKLELYKVRIVSSPINALAVVNKLEVGRTPVVIPAPAGDGVLHLEISIDGHKPFVADATLPAKTGIMEISGQSYPTLPPKIDPNAESKEFTLQVTLEKLPKATKKKSSKKKKPKKGDTKAKKPG